MQSFDQYGRLNQVTVNGISAAFKYGYLEGTHLQKSLAMPNGVTRTFGYEPNRDLLTMIVHSNATERLVQRDFTYDGLGRLENRTLFRANESPVQPDAFGYNNRSELTNAVIGANAFAYNFDPIGNRNFSAEFGTNTAYITSALNQYTSISNSVSSVPLCEMNPEFDLDGNQTLLKTTTGIWHVTYNAENRPVLFSNDTTKVEMAYDYMGRRFEYKESVSGTLTRHERYLYRGYLQIAALDMLNSASVKHSITWDPSEPVASRPLILRTGTAAYYYSVDQVKNVSELFDSTGAIAATYDYSPFGQITSALSVGSSTFDVSSNPLTFSSEVHDSTLGLQYYNYRHLNTLDGRWVSRDSIAESGGVNLYLAFRNDAVQLVDSLGHCPVFVTEDESGAQTEVLKSLDIKAVPEKIAQKWIGATKMGESEGGFTSSVIFKKCDFSIRLFIVMGPVDVVKPGKTYYYLSHQYAGDKGGGEFPSEGLIWHESGHAFGYWTAGGSACAKRVHDEWSGKTITPTDEEKIKKQIADCHYVSLSESRTWADTFTRNYFDVFRKSIFTRTFPSDPNRIGLDRYYWDDPSIGVKTFLTDIWKVK